MKQLKKLSLQKEELVNLNPPQMDSIKGGTGWRLSILSPISTFLTCDILTDYANDLIEYLSYGDDSDVDYISQRIVEGACMMPPIDVYPTP